MKRKVFKAISGILFNAVMGFILAIALGGLPALGAVAAVGGSMLLGGFMPTGSACAGLYAEIWTGELVGKLRAADTAPWLDGIPDYSGFTDKNIIHLVDVGVDPDVLINNTTYPIPITAIDDADIPISLDKFQTEATPITDDELQGLSYDKRSSIQERHAKAILEAKYKKSIHALAPASNAAKTPVIATTGANDGNGRRMITRQDIIRLKDKFDKLQVPEAGRRLVLCTDHVNDLLMYDQKFAEQYYNYASGKIMNMYGFEVYSYVANPSYAANGGKLAWGVTPSAGQHQASVAFYVNHAFKASGTTKFYLSEAATDPTTQRTLLNYRHYFVTLPKKQEALGAIYSSAYVPAITAAPDAVTFDLTGGMTQIQVNATSDFLLGSVDEHFTVVKNGNILSITADDNTAGAAAFAETLTLTLVEDITKTETITLNQPKAS